MPRKIPAERFEELVRGATEVFTTQGYARTQMATIAEAVGVSKGTLYLYVESKDALLNLCFQYADDPGGLERPEVLPIPTPAPGAMVAVVSERLAEGARFPMLEEALSRTRAADPRKELHDVLFELYTLLEENCRAVKLIERCSDHPELGPLWHALGRGRNRSDMARYVALRVRAKQFRAVEHPQLAARVALETVATWAMHIKWDPAPEPYEPVSTKEFVIEQVSRGLLPDPVPSEESERES